MNMLTSRSSQPRQPAWQPARTHPRALKRMGQQAGLEAFAASPALALTTDVILMLSSAYLAIGYTATTRAQAAKAAAAGKAAVAQSPAATFWWIVAAAATIKGLHDLSRVSAR